MKLRLQSELIKTQSLIVSAQGRLLTKFPRINGVELHPDEVDGIVNLWVLEPGEATPYAISRLMVGIEK